MKPVRTSECYHCRGTGTTWRPLIEGQLGSTAVPEIVEDSVRILELQEERSRVLHSSCSVCAGSGRLDEEDRFSTGFRVFESE